MTAPDEQAVEKRVALALMHEMDRQGFALDDFSEAINVSALARAAIAALAQPRVGDGDSGGMRLLVCGGRDFADELNLFRTLDYLHRHRIACVIHGAARGADSLAGKWAREQGVPCRSFPADWNRHGRAAGAIRNQQMLDEGRPDLVVAFPGGRGTADMVRRAKAAGIPVQAPLNPRP